jgi:hypothetical protein
MFVQRSKREVEAVISKNQTIKIMENQQNNSRATSTNKGFLA